MNILRRIVVALLAAGLPFLLFTTAFDFGIIRTAGTPATAKKLLADSGIYSNLIPAALEQANNASGSNNSVSLVDPIVKTAAVQTLTPQFLQQSSENIIDGIYHWLDGKVAQPDFSISLADKKNTFATLVAEHAAQTASQLPRCSLAQSQALAAQGPNFDVFKAQCLPAGTTPEQVSAQIKQELLGNQDFLKDPIITANTLKSGNSGQPVFEKESVKKIPGYYQWAKRTPIILTVLVLLFTAGIIFLSADRWKGLRRAGIIFAVAGLMMLIFAWALNYGITKQALPRLNIIDNMVLRSELKSVIADLTQAIDKNYWLFGGLYAALGAGAIAGLELHRRKAKPEPVAASQTHDPQKPQDSSPGRHQQQ